jgi:hypothetical protein
VSKNVLNKYPGTYRTKQVGIEALFAAALRSVLFGLLFDTEDGGDKFFPPRRLLTFTELNGVMSQKIELFSIVTSNNGRLFL